MNTSKNSSQTVCFKGKVHIPDFLPIVSVGLTKDKKHFDMRFALLQKELLGA